MGWFEVPFDLQEHNRKKLDCESTKASYKRSLKFAGKAPVEFTRNFYGEVYGPYYSRDKFYRRVTKYSYPTPEYHASNTQIGEECSWITRGIRTGDTLYCPWSIISVTFSDITVTKGINQ